MFVIGTLPALLALLIRGRLKEPERWKTSRRGPARPLGSAADRSVLRPALATQRPGRLCPGLFRRRRPVGHRLFQLRPHSRQNPSARQAMAGTGRRDVLEGRHLAGAKRRQRPRHLFFSVLTHATSAAARPSPSDSRAPYRHGRHVLVSAQPDSTFSG